MDISKYIEKARAAVRKKNFNYAMDLYKQALTLAPDDTDVRAELRKVQSAAAQQNGAKKGGGLSGLFGKLRNATSALLPPKTKEAAEKQMNQCEDMLCKNPGDIQTLMALGRAAAIAGHYNTAIMTFENINQLTRDPKIKRIADRARAESYEARGQGEDVKKAYDIWSALAKSDQTDRHAHQKARDIAARLQSNKIEDAALAGKKGGAARTAQTDEQKRQAKKLQLIASQEFRSEEDFELGIEIIDDKLAERPDDAGLYAQRGDMYLRLGDVRDRAANYKKALEDYKKAQELSPADYRWVMREHDLKIRHEESELKKLRKLAANGDEKAKAEYTERYKKLSAFRLQSYERREKEYPTDLEIKFELGNLYLQYKKYKDALQRFQSAVNDPKYRNKALLSMGKCFIAQKQYDLAIRRFNEGISGLEIMNNQKMELLYARGDCYEQMGNKEEARKDYMAIYEVDVGYKDVAKRVERLE